MGSGDSSPTDVRRDRGMPGLAFRIRSWGVRRCPITTRQPRLAFGSRPSGLGLRPCRLRAGRYMPSRATSVATGECEGGNPEPREGRVRCRMLHRAEMRRGWSLGICMLVLGANGPGLEAQTGVEMMKPAALVFPMVLPVGCPTSEACPAGLWRACDSLPVLEDPGASTAPVAWLARDQTFAVETGALVVQVPGVVRVLEDTRKPWWPEREVNFVAGDTLFVLGHRGEGYFNVWYLGQMVAVEIFWPWESGGGWEIRGEVLQEEESEAWHRVATDAGKLGWIKRAESSLFLPRGRRDARACPPG